MHILFITMEAPLAADAVATGNAIRTAQLKAPLQRAGHTTTQTWLEMTGAGQDGVHADAFRSRDELKAVIVRQRPDVILVSYWELLELLPFDLPQPVILDFVAPRPLELLYEHPARVKTDLDRLQATLSKCDLLMTGNQSQRDLLWFTLLQAGFDLRACDPVLVVPLGAEPAGKPESDPVARGWTLVSGGVHWPWRRSDEYWKAIQAMKNDAGGGAPRLVLFGGPYRWEDKHPDDDGETEVADTGQYQTQGLAPYSHFSRFLLENAHIGLELAQANIERAHSQSFRSLEFLRHGLPLICNGYLPIARLVENYEAGWTVDGPDDIADLLRGIMQHPEEWKKRSANALRLVGEVLSPDETVKPLLAWLEKPAKAPRLPVVTGPAAPAVLGKPPLAERLRRQARLARRVALGRLFRKQRTNGNGEGILIVTRSDLFPSDHGAAVKIVETARGLSQHGQKVGIVSDDRKYWWRFENGRVERCALPFWLRFLSLPRPLSRLLHFSKDLPESNSFLYLPLTDGSFFWHCLYAGRKLDAGILQAEFPAYAKPCIDAREILDAAVVLVEHNVEYARLKEQVAELSGQQFDNLRAIEIDLCNRSDAVVCVSDNDRAQLLKDGVKPALLHTIPHGFNPEPFGLPAQAGVRKKFSLPDNAVLLAFHGTFSYPPNRDALQVFADFLLPKLNAAGSRFHVIAIGRNPPRESIHPDIHFTGSVDQVGPWLKACDMAVVPLREGGGTRMKIIDCFAAGLPVVSTSKGIEGIPAVNGREAFICDDWLDMSNRITELAASGDLRARLSSAGLEFTAGMDWKSLGKRYLEIYSAIRRVPK